MHDIKDPVVLDSVFNDNDFNNIKSLFPDPKSGHYQEDLSRWVVSNAVLPELQNYAYLITPLARKIFNNEYLLPSYTLFSHYEGVNANLIKHKDDNACTYTIDLCIFQKYPWDIYVEGIPYTLKPNQALAYYGNDQLHWREKFPEPETNYVQMIFFHFVEPDHWFFTKGPSYLDVIRNNITEEEWLSNENKS